MKRARVGVAIAATGIAAVLGISLLTPSGGANPALPTLVSDNPADYTPVISGTALPRRRRRRRHLPSGPGHHQDRDQRLRRRGHRLGHRQDHRCHRDQLRQRDAVQRADRRGSTRPSTRVHRADRRAHRTARSRGRAQHAAAAPSGSAGSSRRSTASPTAAWSAGTCATNKLFTGFNARIGADGRTARVYDVKYFCGRLWVAGDFTSAGGVTRTALVSLDPNTGTATSQVNLGISGTAGSTAGPDPGHQDRAEPGLPPRCDHRQLHRVAGHERYQVAVLNVSEHRQRHAGAVVQPAAPAGQPAGGRLERMRHRAAGLGARRRLGAGRHLVGARPGPAGTTRTPPCATRSAA